MFKAMQGDMILILSHAVSFITFSFCVIDWFFQQRPSNLPDSLFNGVLSKSWFLPSSQHFVVVYFNVINPKVVWFCFGKRSDPSFISPQCFVIAWHQQHHQFWPLWLLLLLFQGLICCFQVQLLPVPQIWLRLLLFWSVTFCLRQGFRFQPYPHHH